LIFTGKPHLSWGSSFLGGYYWGWNCVHTGLARRSSPHASFYFWLDPKVTKAQEPIKGDFCCAKPRTLFTASCFYRVSVWFEFLIFCIGYIVTIFYYDSCSIPAIAIPLCAPPITGDGFGPLFLILYVWDFCPRSPPTPKGEPAR